MGKDSDPGCVSVSVWGKQEKATVCLAWLSIAVSSSLWHAEANLIRAQGALMTKIAPYIKADSAFPEQTKYRNRCCRAATTNILLQTRGKGRGNSRGQAFIIGKGVLNSNHGLSTVLKIFIFSLFCHYKFSQLFNFISVFRQSEIISTTYSKCNFGHMLYNVKLSLT